MDAATIVEAKDEKLSVVFDNSGTALVKRSDVKPLEVEDGERVLVHYNDLFYFPATVTHCDGTSIHVVHDSGEKAVTNFAMIRVSRGEVLQEPVTIFGGRVSLFSETLGQGLILYMITLLPVISFLHLFPFEIIFLIHSAAVLLGIGLVVRAISRRAKSTGKAKNRAAYVFLFLLILAYLFPLTAYQVNLSEVPQRLFGDFGKHQLVLSNTHPEQEIVVEIWPTKDEVEHTDKWSTYPRFDGNQNTAGPEITTVLRGGEKSFRLAGGNYWVFGSRNGVQVYRKLLTARMFGETTLKIDVPNPGQEPPSQKLNKEEWVQLFNGKDLTGWKTHPDHPGQWEVKDSILTGTSRATLISKNDYCDFHLRASLRYSEKSHATIAFRATIDTHGETSVGGVTTGATGLYAQGKTVEAVQGKKGLSQPKTWLDLDLIVRGKQVTVKINGEPCAGAVLDGMPEVGKINLNAYEPGTVIEFRKIEIKELLPATSKENDKTELQGDWRVISYVDEGRPEQDLSREMKWEFFHKRFWWYTAEGAVEYEGTFELDSSTSPMRITFRGNKGDSVGIYRLEGDQLTICFQESSDEKKRPEQFSGKGTSRNLLVLHRLKNKNFEMKLDDWTELFNGKDLTGWKTHPTQPGEWKVEKDHLGRGLLVGRNGKSHLFTGRGDFENFHLRAEVKISDKGNSGILFRCPFAINASKGDGPEGYEAQIDSTRDPNKTGSLFRIDKNAISVLHSNSNMPVGPERWFLLEVLAEAGRIRIRVNGEELADYVAQQPRFSKGYLVLQVDDKNTEVQFRKIEIRELPPTVPSAVKDAILLLNFDQEDFYQQDGHTYVRDLSGHGHDARCEGVQHIAEGKAGGGLSNNGTGHLRLAKSLIANQSDFTIAGWMRLEKIPELGVQFYSIKPQGAPDSKGSNFHIICQPGAHIYSAAWNEDHKPSLWVHEDTDADLFQTGEWFFLAVRLEKGTAGKGRYRITVGDQTLERNLQMMKNSQVDSLIDVHFYNAPGLLDELGVWTRALSDEEIARLRERGLAAR
jgi:uncharacterized protein (TIGR03067 family)